MFRVGRRLSLSVINHYLGRELSRSYSNSRDHQLDLRSNAILDFSEENRSLESTILSLRFTELSLRNSRHRVETRNRLQYLQITCFNAMDGQAPVSSIALLKGAGLKLFCSPPNDSSVVNEVLSGISTTHISYLQSSTLMEYRAHSRVICFCCIYCGC